MAARERAAKAGSAYQSVASSPYVQRLMQDAELRQNIRDAFETSRRAYGRLANGKAPSKALMEDKKLQRDLREATESLREAADQIRGKRRRKRHRGRRLFMLILIGGAITLVVSEGARKAVLDRLFGAEEDFEYSSSTTPA